MSEKITLPSGAKLEITPLPYFKAWAVTQKVTRAVEKIDIDLKGVDFKNIMITDIVNLKSPICALLSSDEIIEAAKECFTRCTYNGVKINDETFEPIASRKDFLPCVFYALRANISPFFSNLLTFFGKN
jgi:hypothetical protein